MRRRFALVVLLFVAAVQPGFGPCTDRLAAASSVRDETLGAMQVPTLTGSRAARPPGDRWKADTRAADWPMSWIASRRCR